MFLCVFVQLRRGSILVDFTVSAAANFSDNTAVDLLSVSRRRRCNSFFLSDVMIFRNVVMFVSVLLLTSHS